jgi:NAD(P)-dependent dehydrogenase (short-subunit alcohol dehydrogenase family)
MATRTWFITGSSSGFGRQMTELLLARGDRVAATARRPNALSNLVSRYGDLIWTAQLDVTDTARVRQVMAEAFDALGRIDVVISNAGYGLAGAAEELSDRLIEQQIATNLLGSIQVGRAAIPRLREQGGGRIIQVGSWGGQHSSPGLSLYHATKWGIEGFYESVIPELAPFNIEVTIVEPGRARTEFVGGSMVFGDQLEVYDGVMSYFRDLAAGDIDGRVAQQSAPGDPRKVAQAIIDSVDVSPAPRRLTLGSDAYDTMLASLRERLEEMESNRDLAYSTDADDVVAARARQARTGQ